MAAWSLLGAATEGYSPVQDPISRLAAVDASTRVAMTGGFAAFAGGVSLYAVSLRQILPGPAATAAVTAAVATAGVAALPLGGRGGGPPHAIAAGVSYAALALLPVFGAAALSRLGHRRAAAVSVAAGVATAASLAGSVVLESPTGLLQRTGLTIADAWIVATAAWMLRRRRPTG